MKTVRLGALDQAVPRRPRCDRRGRRSTGEHRHRPDSRDLCPAPQGAVRERDPAAPAGGARRLLDDAGPAGHQGHAEHGRRRGEDRCEGAGRGHRGADRYLGPACAGPARDEVDRELQAPRGHGRRCACDAARCTHVRVPRPARLDRAPRIRDFRGLDPGSFDGRGNYSIGIREQIIFPEVDYDRVPAIRGLDIAITTSAESDEAGHALLAALGLPFAEFRRDA